MMNQELVRILYTNYKGETRHRTVRPDLIVFGRTQWHDTPQWLLHAYDYEKEAVRHFAMQDIKEWVPVPEDEAKEIYQRWVENDPALKKQVESTLQVR